jgi:hypothetical protein
MVKIPSIDSIELLPNPPSFLPPFNLCTMSLRSHFNHKSHKNEIYLVSLRFFPYWDIEQFTPADRSLSKLAVRTFVAPIAGTSLSAAT